MSARGREGSTREVRRGSECVEDLGVNWGYPGPGALLGTSSVRGEGVVGKALVRSCSISVTWAGDISEPVS